MSEPTGRRPFSAEKYVKPKAEQPASPQQSAAQLRSRLMERRTARFNEPEPGPREILSAVEELRKDLMRGLLRQRVQGETSDLAQEMDQDVRIEIAQMVRSIARAKSEIASIKHPGAQKDEIETASNELDEIVAATEDATTRILDANEKLQGLLDEVAAMHPDDLDLQTKLDEAGGHVITVLEACNFQDVTGQRITKVVRTLHFIEERILAMISIWGPDAFTELPIQDSVGEDPDDPPMHGPQATGQGISQDEIDALFD